MVVDSRDCILVVVLLDSLERIRVEAVVAIVDSDRTWVAAVAIADSDHIAAVAQLPCAGAAVAVEACHRSNTFCTDSNIQNTTPSDTSSSRNL